MAALDAFSLSTRVEREAATDARAKAAAPKPVPMPKETFPFTVGIFRRLAKCDDISVDEDEDLPRLYQMLAKAKKSEYRLVVQN